MSIVTVLVGQCGNQLGDELFTQLHRIAAHTPSPFFSADGKARCVLVDSEPKVVQGVRERHPEWVRSENVIDGQSGRGNSWGLGYLGVNDPQSRRYEHNVAAPRAFHNLGKAQRAHDDKVLARALCAIHRETRRTYDCPGEFDAILVLHSLAGGTGSGLGSRLVEKIRYYFVQPRRDGGGGAGEEAAAAVDEREEDAMRRRDGIDGVLVEKRRACHVVSVAVAPLVAGEMATQGLNATLTLRVLLTHADAVVLLRNEDVMAAPADSSSLRRARLPPSHATPLSREGVNTGRNDHNKNRLSCDAAATNRTALCLPSQRARVHNPSSYAQSVLSTLTRRCTTFKEANEVFVGLLLPLLGFGRRSRATHVTTSSSPSPSPSHRAAKKSSSSSERSDCSIAALLRQCCPQRSSPHSTTCMRVSATGSTSQTSATDRVTSSHLLTLVPLPQRTWERFRGAVTRCRLYRLDGAADSMPGYTPSLPLDQILTNRAKEQHHRCLQASSLSLSSSSSTPAWSADRLSGQARRMRRTGGRVHVRGGLYNPANVDHAWGNDTPHEYNDEENDCMGEGGVYRSEEKDISEVYEWEEDYEEEDDGRGSRTASRNTCEDDVAGEVGVAVPRELLTCYQSLGRAAVAQLYQTLEGVAVVNQVRELNASLLLPLIRSAALKLHVGAFVSTFVDVGITVEHMEEACRSVARVLSSAEEASCDAVDAGATRRR